MKRPAAAAPDATPEDEAPASPMASTSYQRVRDALRNDIIRGVFGDEPHLRLSVLAARYGLSAAPIREALNQLEAEGLLELLPNRGARLRRIDRDFVAELFEIRLALEPMLVERAVVAATDADIERLQAVQSELERAIARRQVDEVVRLNREFHRGFYRIRPNRSAMRLLDQHSAVTSAVRRHYGFPPTRFRTIVEEHRALLAACARRDGAEAHLIMRAHIAHSIEELLPRVPE